MGIPEYEAKRYEGAVKNGGTLLSVHCDTSDQVSAAKDALKETGAKDISTSGEEGSPKGTAATDVEEKYELNNAYLKDDVDHVVVMEVPAAEEDLATTGRTDRSRYYPS